MKVYLAGGIFGCTDGEASGWRSLAAHKLKSLGHEAVDPMARDFRGSEVGNEAEIVEGDKADIDTCDALLVAFNGPSVGTSMEVLYAWERGKMVHVFTESPASPWLTYHATIHQTMDDAIAAL